jgi:hypothetical protein
MHTPTPYLTPRFALHYVEMVVAMFAGMAVLGLPLGWALAAMGSGWGELRADAPALHLLGMAATMTLPMVAWMRFRGHGGRASGEMALSMVLPALAVVALLWVGLVEDLGTLLVAEHVAMLLAMLGAMLLRPAEYAGHAHGRAAQAGVTA